MIYLSGATGHIGNNTARYFLAHNIEITLLIRTVQPAIEDLPFPTLKGNLFSDQFLDSILHEGDVFIHMAGVIDLSKKIRSQAEFVNVTGTERIVDACVRHGVFLIFASSVDAINKPLTNTLISEPDGFDIDALKSHYSKSKAKGTAYVLDALSKGILHGAIVYPSAVIGINDFKPSAAGRQIYKASKHWLLPKIKGGYNFVDVVDCAAAIYHIATRRIEGSFILAGHEKTLNDVYQTIKAITHKKKWILPVPTVFAYVGCLFLKHITPVMIDALRENYHYDTSRMKSVLGVQPKAFEQTLKETIEWFEERNPSKR